MLLAVAIDARGNLENVQIQRSSGHDELDAAAVEAARAVDRFPRPPAALAELRRPPTVLPIAYRLD